MTFPSATDASPLVERGASGVGGQMTPGAPTTWVIDHCAERLTEVFNQPVDVPHPNRRKADK